LRRRLARSEAERTGSNLFSLKRFARQEHYSYRKQDIQEAPIPMPDDLKSQPLKIHLARTPAAISTRLLKLEDIASRHLIQIDTVTTGELYIQLPTSGPPDWAYFFLPHLSPDQFGTNSSTGAVFLVRKGENAFAMTFGRGWSLLEKEHWEERFGLKVALNCIGENTVRTIDKHSLDQLLCHTSEQASRDATPREFGFDIEQDLLKGVTGKPLDEETFGKRITGAESLFIDVPVSIESLPLLLDKLHEKFLDASYQEYFPWVDQIEEVANRRLKEDLDAFLTARINSGNTEHIWMAVPEWIEWNKVSRFRFLARAGTFEYADIHLGALLRAKGSGEVVDTDWLSRRKIECIDLNGETLHKWTAYQCLYAEIEHEGKTFLLSGGKWYSVQADFVQKVNTALETIRNYEGELPVYRDSSEPQYLERITQDPASGIALLDKKLIKYGGDRSAVEFCDLYTAHRDMFHIKRYGQASALSHLFAQGVVSGETFQMDAAFRRAVNDQLPPTHQIPNPGMRPGLEQYRIIFAIISDRLGALRLPFFSRLNLKHAAKRLEMCGFRVAKTKISVDTVFSKTAKLKPRMRKK